jgi:signal peptidase I
MGMSAGQFEPQPDANRPRRLLRHLLSSIGVPLAIALFVRATLVQAYHIPSGSMENTLFPGDFVLAEKLSYGPHVPGRLPGLSAALPSVHLPGLRAPRPGDLVIFEHPENPSIDLIKRCVAVEGQVVEVREKQLYVDGERFASPPGLKHADQQMLPGNRDNFGPYTVPPGHIFVMGDNRDFSHDSRFFGAVPKSNLRARPLAIYFSWNGRGQLPEKVRWRHLGPVR